MQHDLFTWVFKTLSSVELRLWRLTADRRQPWTVESSRAAAAAAGVMQYLSTGIGSRALERGGGPVCDSPALILLLILSSRLSGHLLCYCCTSPSPPCTYRPTVGLGQPSEPSSRTTTFYTLVHSKVFLLFPHIMRRMVYFTYWSFIILSVRMRTCLINQFQISLPCRLGSQCYFIDSQCLIW